jgi:hypothetical protein
VLSTVPITAEPAAEQWRLPRENADPDDSVKFDYMRDRKRPQYHRSILRAEWYAASADLAASLVR